MNQSFTTEKIIIVVLGVVLIVGGIVAGITIQSEKKEISKLEKTVKVYKAKEEALEKEDSEGTKKVETLYVDQNGKANDALVKATSELFSMVFDYDTENPEETISKRKESASHLTNKDALNALFPLDADKGTATVETVSKLEKEPEVYLMPSSEQTFQALVLIRNEVSIAGSQKQEGTFMYKVWFDPATNQFTTIQNLGIVPGDNFYN